MTTASEQANTEAARALHAEAALRERERELSQLVDMVPSHIWRLTPDGEPAFFNKRMADFLGLDVTDTDKPGMSRLDALIETVHPDDAAKFGAALRHCLMTGENFAMRYRLRRADGVYRWMSSRAEPMRNDLGQIVQWYGLCHDIDDQIHAEEALRRSEQQLRQLVDTVPTAIWCTSPDGAPGYRNKRHAQITGATIANGVTSGGYTSPLANMAHPDDRAAAEQARTRAYETGSTYVVRYRQIRSDGTYRWTESRAEPLRDESGEIVQWYGVSVDIHDLVTAQEALRRSEQRLQQMIDAVPVYILSFSADGEPTYVNKRYQDYLGFSVPSFDSLREQLRAIIHPDDFPEMHSTLSNCFKTGETFLMRFRRRGKDGIYRWTEGRAEPARDQDGTIIQWYAVSLDIEDQMRAEETLRQSEQRFQQMIDAVPVFILSFSATGEPTYINKRYQDYLGLSIPHFPSLREQQRAIIHPDDYAEMYGTLSNCFQTGVPFLLRYRRRGKDGAYRWTEGRAEPLRDRDGTIVQWYAVSLDIDDQVHAEAALRQSERRALQLVETLPALIFCAAPNGEPTYRSRQLREFLGFDVQDKLGPGNSRLTGTLDAVIHPDELTAVKEQYGHSLATGAPYALRHRLRRADGEYRWVETRAAPMRDAEGAIVQWNGICLDIEDQVRAQDKLRAAQETLARASQAASLAELSASIAHEVNQPLAAVVANSYACQRWLKSDPPNLERAQITVERIIRDANSAADVVSRIRALFRQDVAPRTHTALASVIAEARNLMAEDAARRRIRMDVDVEDNLPLFAFDRVQVQQVLINLIRNAMDAMEFTVGNKVLEMRVRRMGNAIQTEISDRGRGIESPDKIFEPFFTTKESGMGMGLAICRSIVESHGGRLWAENNEPEGATFVFTLPIELKAVT